MASNGRTYEAPDVVALKERSKQAAVAVFCTGLGAGIGTMILPGLGTAIGGMVGLIVNAKVSSDIESDAPK
jgi:hypothetical protein